MVRTVNCKYYIEKGNGDKFSPRRHLLRVRKIKKTLFEKFAWSVLLFYKGREYINQWICMNFLSEIINLGIISRRSMEK